MKRKLNSKVIIAAEGKTEKTYFGNFSRRDKRVSFSHGNETDIIGIFNNLVSYINKHAISAIDGDLIYLVVDIDNDKGKITKLDALKKQADELGIKLIYSNACFEVWFLLHFLPKTANMSSENVEKELKKHIPNYNKGMDVYSLLESKKDDAIKNAKNAFNNAFQNETTSTSSYSTVYEIIEEFQD